MNEPEKLNNGLSTNDNINAIVENLSLVPLRLQHQTFKNDALLKNEKIKFEKKTIKKCDNIQIAKEEEDKVSKCSIFPIFFLTIPILYAIFPLIQYNNCFVDSSMPISLIINLINAMILSAIITKITASLLCRLSTKSSISNKRPKEIIYRNFAAKNNSGKKILFAASMIFLCIFESVEAIRITSLTVPPHQVSGENVELECHYDQESDVLYSVKWYRGSHEFFRVIPGDTSPMQVFDMPGVVVDTSLSDKNKVTLRSVTRESSGKYKCEVSADFPSFHTATKESEMLVVDLPSSVPNITGGRTKYHVGDEVHVNCTSAKSRPAASLMWYINGNPAKIENLVEYAPFQDDDGLETSRLGLRFYVGAKDFPEGVLRIRCTATIAAVYWQSSEEAVEGQLPQTSPALESKGVYTGGGSLVDISSLMIIATNLVQGTLLGCYLFR